MDLLARLRHPGYTAHTGGLVLVHNDARKDMREAADEIEQLRAALADVVELLSDEDMADIGKVGNAKLRANLALEQ